MPVAVIVLLTVAAAILLPYLSFCIFLFCYVFHRRKKEPDLANDPHYRPHLARIRAAREEENRKKRRIFWIIGWILCFPVPLTVILVRSKMPKILKILIVAAAWAIYIAMIASGMASGEKKPGGNGSEAARPEISHTMHATE